MDSQNVPTHQAHLDQNMEAPAITNTTAPSEKSSGSMLPQIPLAETATVTTTNTRNAEKDTEEFPEGGRGWLVVAGTFVLMGASFGMSSIYGQYQRHYLEAFPTTKQSILILIGSLQPFLIYFFAIPSTIFIKRVGPHIAVATSGFILIFSLMMTSLCRQVWQYALAQGVLFGIGSSISVFVSYTMPQQWFKKKRATAIGIVASGSSVGGLLWPLALYNLTEQVGFDWANRIMGFIFIPLMAFATFAVKSREHLIGQNTNNIQQEEPQEEAFFVEYSEPNEEHSVCAQDDLQQETGDKSASEHLENLDNQDNFSSNSSSSCFIREKHWLRQNVFHSGFLVDWSVLKDYHYALIVLGNFVGFFGLFNPLFFIVTYSEVLGIDPNIEKYIMTITNSGSVLGRILPGIIGDKIGRLNMLIMAVLSSGLVVLCLWLPSRNTATVFAAGFGYGMTSGALVSLAPAALGQLFGYHGLQSRLSIFFLACSFGSLIGPVIGSSFLPNAEDSYVDGKGSLQGYNKLIIFTGVVLLASAAVLTFVRFSINRKVFAFV